MKESASSPVYGEEGCAISLIIPVYNVADYMDTCMESVVGQTFSDWEAILIDDGSTDGSPVKCDAWARKDPRIRVIHQENRGVSAARNRGIEEARGRYLSFADPDDWLDLTYLEKLYKAAEEAQAEFAECDIYRYNGKNGEKIRRACYGTMGIPWTLEEHMKYGSTATYKAISRKSLWDRYGIRLPSCAFESPAVYALVLAAAEKVVNVREPLYYYRRFRPASLIETGYAKKDGTANNTLGVEAMEHLLAEFRRTGLYERYKDTLEGVVKYRLSDILAMQFYRKSPADYAETEVNFRTFLSQTFPKGRNWRYITFGGYNLNRILVHMDLLHDPFLRFNFSSLISVAGASEGGDGRRVKHRNRYREMMLQREADGAFWKILAEARPAYLFLDLIEERFPVLAYGGRYITESDALETAEDPGFSRKEIAGEDVQDPVSAAEAGTADTGSTEEIAEAGSGKRSGGIRRIPRESAECGALFSSACRVFAAKVRETAPDMKIAVVENYLYDRVGDPGIQAVYPEAEKIRAMNRILKKCYESFYEAVPEAVRIVPSEIPALSGLLFTDKGYEYGAIPSHGNEIANRRIAARIEEML